jgi:hypothetical protein
MGLHGLEQGYLYLLPYNFVGNVAFFIKNNVLFVANIKGEERLAVCIS